VAAVCTGIYPLAESGLLDGCSATTHWRYADDVKTRWPRVRVDSDAIFIKAGNLYTSAGVTAGIDLALALVEEDLGGVTALAVARELVVYLKRAGGQLQYSAPLHFQRSATGEFREIASWMVEHMGDDLTVEALAERMQCSPRHFARRFKAVFGSTPARFVERLRLDAARWRLMEGDVAIEALGASVGYQSSDAFRRAFERHFGVAPTEYRERFGVQPL
jgi:transcriptional regulator GlxA family with amidase domain